MKGKNETAHWMYTETTLWDAKTKDGKCETELSIESAKCSKCGKWAEHVNAFTSYMLYKYCPHCGKRMVGVDNDWKD